MRKFTPQLVSRLADLANSTESVQVRVDQALDELRKYWGATGLILEAARRFEDLVPILACPADLPIADHSYWPLIMRAPSLNTTTMFQKDGPLALPPGIASVVMIPVQSGEDRLATLLVLFDTPVSSAELDVAASAALAQMLGFILQAPGTSNRLSWSDPRVQSVVEIGRTLAATLDIDDLAPRTYRLIGEVMALDEFFVAYYDAETDTLDYRYMIQDGIQYPPERMAAEGTLAKTAIDAMRPVHYYLPPTAGQEERLRRWEDKSRRIARSILIVPLFENGAPVAAISAQTYKEYAYTAEDEQLLSIIGSYFAIAARNAGLLASTEAQSLTDDLTGLGNRRALRRTMQQCVDHYRHTGEPISLILFDADSLKSVNDTHGHLAGDKFLITIARQIKSHLRDKDRAFRHGGDEFAACLIGVTAEQAAVIARRIIRAIGETPVEFAGTVFHGCASAGVAEYREQAEPGGMQPIEAWYAAADAATYEAKQTRPGTVSVAEQTDALRLPPVAATEPDEQAAPNDRLPTDTPDEAG